MGKRKRSSAFGAYAVREAQGHDKKKWTIEIVPTALAAARKAKALSKEFRPSGRASYRYPVCVFDLSRWTRKPVCFLDGKRTTYSGAASGLKPIRPGGKLRRLALEKGTKAPIVKED